MSGETPANELRNREINLISALHQALPQTALQGLPAIDWETAGIDPAYRPSPHTPPMPNERLAWPKWPANAALPTADVVVITWTTAEWAALDHVFCDSKKPMQVSEVSKGDWRQPWANYCREYYTIRQYMVDVKKTYNGGVPSLDNEAWGQFRMVQIGGLRVLLIKSGMHLAQDGTALPLCQFVRRICDEAQPKLLLSIGTAGGVREEDALGTALITNQAVFYLLKEFKNAPFNRATFQSDWTPRSDLLKSAQELTIQVPGFTILPVSPQYLPGKIDPAPPDSQIKVVLDRPIITTDAFLFGTTTQGNGLTPGLGCIVEMDDAVLGMVCTEKNVSFGFIRNVSDPVINGDLPEKVQEAWAAYIYQELGLYTSYNGALAAWAVIAGEAMTK